jgi:hypothetical protein
MGTMADILVVGQLIFGFMGNDGCGVMPGATPNWFLLARVETLHATSLRAPCNNNPIHPNSKL